MKGCIRQSKPEGHLNGESLGDTSAVRLNEVLKLFLCEKAWEGNMDRLRDYIAKKGMPEPELKR
jgi:hypothetical protein